MSPPNPALRHGRHLHASVAATTAGAGAETLPSLRAQATAQ